MPNNNIISLGKYVRAHAIQLTPEADLRIKNKILEKLKTQEGAEPTRVPSFQKRTKTTTPPSGSGSPRGVARFLEKKVRPNE